MKVWTNGCFDIIHRGHLELFKFCKILAGEDGKVIVGIDSDTKVKKDKGKNRPIISLQDRIFMLQSIEYIDKVIPFDTTKELRDTIKWYRPNIMVIGSDWKGKDVIGQEFTDKLVFFDRIEGYSTTDMIGKI